MKAPAKVMTKSAAGKAVVAKSQLKVAPKAAPAKPVPVKEPAPVKAAVVISAKPVNNINKHIQRAFHP